MKYQGQKFAIAYHSYVYAERDHDLDSVAKRFRTTPEMIRIYSVRLNPEWKDMKAPVFAALLEPGQTIVIPLPLEERGWHWFPYIPASPETLAEICGRKNSEKRRSGMAALTPQYLWSHVINWQFRDERLRRDLLRVDELDKDPSSVSATNKTSLIWIPYPDTVPVGDVAVGTFEAEKKAAAPPKTTPVQVEHDWVYELKRRLSNITFEAEHLASANEACEELRFKHATQAARLAPLHFLLQLMKRNNVGSIDGLGNALVKLQATANKYMGVNPALFLKTPEDSLRQAHSESLKKDLRAAELKSLVDRYLREELDRDLNTGGVLLNLISGTLEKAYTAWGDGYYSDERDEDIENAVDVIGKSTSGAPPPEAKTALASVMSLVGTPFQYPPVFRKKAEGPQANAGDERSRWQDAPAAVALAPNVLLPSMGNLPGPASLSVAAIKLFMARYLARKAADETFDAKGAASRSNFMRLCRAIYGFTAEEEGIIQRLLARIDGFAYGTGATAAELKGSSLGPILRAQVVENERKLIADETKNLAQKVGGRIQTSKGFSTVLLGLNLMLLGVTWAQLDGDKAFKSLAAFTGFVNFLGTGYTSILASVKLAEAFGAFKALGTWGPAMSQWLAKPGVAAGFGIASGVFCIVSGGLTVWENRHDPVGAVCVSGVFQTLGGGLMVGAAVAVLLGASPAALGVIVAEIGAGLCLVIAGGASDWENLKQLYRPGTQKVFEYHLLQFEKAEEYKTMIKNGAADLEADLKGVADALKTARFSDFWDTYRPQIEAHLSGKFAKNDIGYMFTPSPSFGLQRE